MSTPLPLVRRIATTHNENGQGVVAYDTQVPVCLLPHGSGSALIWATEESPADIASPDDKARAKTGFTNNGSIFRVVDIPPRSVGAMHRSISLDYIIVQRGSVVLTLDDGSKTRVNQGEFVVQQATMHGWDNDTDDWARILAIMLPSEAPKVAGRELEEDLSALLGVN